MGNNSWMKSVFFSRHLVPQNVGNIIVVCYFLNIGLGPTNKSPVSHRGSRPPHTPPHFLSASGLHGKSLGNPRTNPGFLETHISAKSQGLKTTRQCFANFLKCVARSSNVVALTFRYGSRYGNPGIDCLEN